MKLGSLLLVLAFVLLLVCQVTAVHYDEYMKDTWYLQFLGRPSNIEISDDLLHTVIYSKDNVLGVLDNSMNYTSFGGAGIDNVKWRQVLPKVERARDLLAFESKLLFTLSTESEQSIVRGFTFTGDVLFETKIAGGLLKISLLNKVVAAYNEKLVVFLSILSGDEVGTVELPGKVLQAVVQGDDFVFTCFNEESLLLVTVKPTFTMETRSLPLAVPRSPVTVNREANGVIFVQYSSGTAFFTQHALEPWKSQAGFPFLDLVAGPAGTVAVTQLSEHSSEVVSSKAWVATNNKKLELSPVLHTPCRGNSQLEVYALPAEHRVELVFPSFGVTVQHNDGQPISCVANGNVAVVVLSSRVVVAVDLAERAVQWVRAEFLANARLGVTRKATGFVASQHAVAAIDERSGRVRWARFLPSRSPAMLHLDSSVIRGIDEPSEDDELANKAQLLSFEPLLSLVGEKVCVTQSYPPSLRRNYVLKDKERHLSTTSYIACFDQVDGTHSALPTHTQVQRLQNHAVESALLSYLPQSVLIDGVPLAQHVIDHHTSVQLLAGLASDGGLLPRALVLSDVDYITTKPVFIAYLYAQKVLYTFRIDGAAVSIAHSKPLGAGTHSLVQNMASKPKDMVVPVGGSRFLKAGSGAHLVLCSEYNSSVDVHAFHGVTGVAVESLTFADAARPLVAMHDNRIIITYFDTKQLHQVLSVLMLVASVPETSIFGRSTGKGGHKFSLNQSYVLPLAPTHMGFTSSERDLNNVDLLVATADGSVYNVPQLLLDPRRSLQREEDSIPYYTHLFLTPQHLLSQNLTLHGVEQLRSAPGEYESQGLVLVTGLDWFVTTVYPSGKFDSLSEDFSRPFLVFTVSAVAAVTVAAKIYSEQQKLIRKWK